MEGTVLSSTDPLKSYLLKTDINNKIWNKFRCKYTDCFDFTVLVSGYYAKKGKVNGVWKVGHCDILNIWDHCKGHTEPLSQSWQTPRYRLADVNVNYQTKIYSCHLYVPWRTKIFSVSLNYDPDYVQFYAII